MRSVIKAMACVLAKKDSMETCVKTVWSKIGSTTLHKLPFFGTPFGGHYFLGTLSRDHGWGGKRYLVMSFFNKTLASIS